jgi:membrane associated rhomboid family serine protease
LIPLKANVPAWRLAYATLAVAIAGAVAFAVLVDRPALVWPAVFVAGNAVAVWTFGSGVEPIAGHWRTLALLVGAAGLALGIDALAGMPVHAWIVLGAAPAVAALVSLAALRPRARVITLSVVPLFAGVIEVPLAVVAVAWLALEALAVAAW